MASIKELTGGTGDVNPQLLVVTVIQTAVDANTQVELSLPVPRFSSKTGRTIVTEVLRVYAEINELTTVANSHVNGSVGTATQPSADDATTFAHFNYDAIVATAVGFQFYSRSMDAVDLTDGAGHGFLIGVNSIFLSCNSALTALVNEIHYRILYRFKEVPLAEYIGIVSAQNG